MRLEIFMAGMVSVAVAAAFGAQAFEKVPDEARLALKGTRGKPVKAGFVFVNGHYLKPPYTVARYGTAIFINNEQVTDQIVPWRTFLATQPGGSQAIKPAAAPKPAAQTTASKAPSIDDFFEDAPASPPAKPATASASSAGPSSVTDEFAHNEKSKAMVKRINDMRTDISRRLRNDQMLFFGSRYPRVTVPKRLSRDLLAVMPEAIRDASDGADLAMRMRTKGFVFLGQETCMDIIENRADYPALIERRRQIKEEESFQKLLNDSQRAVK